MVQRLAAPLRIADASWIKPGKVVGIGGTTGISLMLIFCSRRYKQFYWAEAIIKGDDVVVHSEIVSKPVAVRYAWADNPVCNLINSAGLPAVPFRTHSRKGITQK